MDSNLRPRCVIERDKISVEFQKNIDKLSQSIRIKSVISRAKLSLNYRELLVFLNQLEGKNPPFVVPQKFFVKELLDKILSLNFFFIKNAKGGLKRIYSMPITPINYTFKSIKPTNIKIYIKDIRQDSISVESYFEVFNIEIPLWYEFLLIFNGELYRLDKSEILESANGVVSDIFKNSFSYDELELLSEKFSVLRKVEKGSKSVSFSSNKSGFLSFEKPQDLDENLYTEILKSYLNNKNYVEFDKKILLFKDSDFNQNNILQIMQKSISHKDIAQFLEKINNLKEYICENEMQIVESQIKASLEEYQKEGVKWLCNLYKNKAFGGLLTDDMGLGKTLQSICFLSAFNFKKTLIITPASLVSNWQSEILKWTNLKECDISINSLKEAKIQILSYEGARINIEKLGVYEVLILDESQKIKNDKTQIFTAISQIKRDFTLILSGTPIENSLLDLWNMISAVNANFRWIYDNKIAPFASDSKKAINLSMQFLAPFIKRRTKDSVLKLPKRHTKSIFVEFSDEEKAAYDRIYNTFASILKTSLAFRLNYALLEGLLRLRQFCSVHKIIPNSLYNCQNLRDSKLEIVLKLVQNTLLKKQKIIIFSQFTKSLESLREALNRNDILYLNGSISKANRAKMIEQFQTQETHNIFFNKSKSRRSWAKLNKGKSCDSARAVV